MHSEPEERNEEKGGLLKRVLKFGGLLFIESIQLILQQPALYGGVVEFNMLIGS